MTLYQNELGSLPASFENLNNLKKLNLAWNQFEEFPSVIMGLRKLEWFGLFYNPIRGDIPRLNHIKEVILEK
jgi:Leucine-rich repeat (LRR) protein